ncbi:hypothetical protein [Streptacidiphilus fuscans]|uniref:Uncharacterized protein n=1 Tax=Streptacidiphilus fuscans TaxID=2789292 RepID=A0A931BA13_9ACTN|nr:hypothetical protein [Streptacidiphilus fuscans]MBF9071776.1 hypothetical protein [Streptacidiphilus fuscans]
MFDVAVARDPHFGVTAQTGEHSPASETIAQVLTDFGFARRTPDSPWALGPVEGSVFLHLRELVAQLRRLGLRVNADPAFDYLAAQSDDPSQDRALDGAARALDAVDRPRIHAAIGSHPEHGPVVRLLDGQMAARHLLQQARFAPVPGSRLHAYTGPAEQRLAASRGVLTQLRAAGLTVASDLAYEPQPAADARLTEVAARARAARATSPHAPGARTPAALRPAVGADPRHAWSRAR